VSNEWEVTTRLTLEAIVYVWGAIWFVAFLEVEGRYGGRKTEVASWAPSDRRPLVLDPHQKSVPSFLNAKTGCYHFKSNGYSGKKSVHMEKPVPGQSGSFMNYRQTPLPLSGKDHECL
jgi:hypothetical protein